MTFFFYTDGRTTLPTANITTTYEHNLPRNPVYHSYVPKPPKSTSYSLLPYLFHREKNK